ncbi:MAG: PTS sugar transporter subunit IIA [Pseudoflavonifractor capillosus]|uniref:PTS sugar transporter subunit IIA n=1 Tax=Pseudoflavonifractor capillosus TaxID=106588 RepID=UPI0023F98F72|nr:PTS sugar transporter subunit IIA [Pseudoflavonifractor capillosus]MCI5928026.1 PTS sugar transporter subunit IIA [Pseudoflavonifractor capillosus]MDY4662120.1 PTS sugar transporter subunit IIA [Pseudoflavonifractor capillosus]
MKLDFFKKLYNAGLFSLHESFDSWEDAVKASIAPMVEKGMVDQEYGNAIIRHVGEYGLYIFLAPHICMPHCKEFQYVKEAGMCIMKCNQPVYPDPNDPELYAELFFPIAAKSEGAHLDSIQDLMEILDDEETVEALLAAKTKEDFERLVNEQ